MFPFATSQAMRCATDQAKAGQGSQSRSKLHAARSRNGRGLLWRLFDAMVESRMRQAEIEIAHHRRLHEGAPKK